ncbi:MAG: YtxH domain-containing protein [Longimicrobiales bacterium]
MYFDEPKSTVPFVTGLIVGVMLGAGLALLAAPASGKRTRRKMLRRVVSAQERAREQLGDWSDEFNSALRAGRRRFASE